MSRKGKEKALDTEVKAMIEDDDGEDELVDEDAEMGGEMIDYEHAWGWQSMQQGAASGSHQSNHQSWMPKPKLVKQEEIDELDEENQDKDMAMDMPGQGRSRTGNRVQPAADPSGPTVAPSKHRCEKCTDADMPSIHKPIGICQRCRKHKIKCTFATPHPTKDKTLATPSQWNPSHAQSKKRSHSSPSHDDEDVNNDDSKDYMMGHPQKTPHTSNNTSKPPPQSQSCPVVMIPQGWPVIHLPARLAPNPTQGSHSESNQHSWITTLAAGPSTIATLRGTDRMLHSLDS
ncbi:hypothetical protein BKA82DRAFT_4018321 [Pisolithus tinctorius]|nr:hypothetical protein BKA82DRAFT_4018321 [Pisolithus tinctorius]